MTEQEAISAVAILTDRFPAMEPPAAEWWMKQFLGYGFEHACRCIEQYAQTAQRNFVDRSGLLALLATDPEAARKAAAAKIQAAKAAADAKWESDRREARAVDQSWETIERKIAELPTAEREALIARAIESAPKFHRKHLAGRTPESSRMLLLLMNKMLMQQGVS